MPAMAAAAVLVLSWVAAAGGGDHGRASRPQHRVANKTQSCNVTHLAWCIDWSLPKPHVKYALSDAPNGSIANLQMSGNLSFLLASHAGLGLPGMLALQSREESQRHQPTNPPRPYIWESSPTGMRLGPDWEAAVALLARELTPLAPRTGTGALAGIMIGDEMVSAGFPLSNMSRLAARLHDTLAPLGLFIYTNVLTSHSRRAAQPQLLRLRPFRVAGGRAVVEPLPHGRGLQEEARLGGRACDLPEPGLRARPLARDPCGPGLHLVSTPPSSAALACRPLCLLPDHAFLLRAD